ncbi:hypothetical protein T01_10852 [Trichinella spiralis]|uniref:Uncharacterized protein n=1 Tax=Trichinella spiralis TaxID=6334 RepID=A0A0V1BDT6_TRISP|nr:hypothetical protein T01_10852 [Trichinella spiralis]
MAYNEKEIQQQRKSLAHQKANPRRRSTFSDVHLRNATDEFEISLEKYYFQFKITIFARRSDLDKDNAWHVCRSLAKDVHKVCMYIENNVSIINKHDLSVGIIFENYGKQRVYRSNFFQEMLSRESEFIFLCSIDCMAAAIEFEIFFKEVSINASLEKAINK